MKKNTRLNSEVYRKAATTMVRGRYGCCKEIMNASGDKESPEKLEFERLYGYGKHDLFYFGETMGAFSYLKGKGESIEQVRENRLARSLALLFMAEMIENGDLK